MVFTSGGTEADNLAISGVAAGDGSALCSAVEHPAVLEACLAVGGSVVGVDRRGVVDLDELADLLDERVRLVSVMLVNNETLTASVDLVSVSAHKFGGPKGVGALVARDRAALLRPILRGGPQERERRAGTQNVAGIVAMAAAAKATVRDREEASRRVRDLSTRLVGGILETVPCVHEATARKDRVDAICNLGIEGVEAEELLVVLDEPSHVLLAMGRTIEEAKRHVRLSLGHATTAADIDAALLAFPRAVGRLRG